MNDKLAEFYQITAAITALLPSNQREYERKMSKKIEKNELGLFIFYAISYISMQ